MSESEWHVVPAVGITIKEIVWFSETPGFLFGGASSLVAVAILLCAWLWTVQSDTPPCSSGSLEISYYPPLGICTCGPYGISLNLYEFVLSKVDTMIPECSWVILSHRSRKRGRYKQPAKVSPSMHGLPMAVGPATENFDPSKAISN